MLELRSWHTLVTLDEDFVVLILVLLDQRSCDLLEFFRTADPSGHLLFVVVVWEAL